MKQKIIWWNISKHIISVPDNETQQKKHDNYDNNAIWKAYFKMIANDEYQVELTNFYYKNYTLFMNEA